MIERGRVAERWRSERWDSLRLLTPNWMTRLPGYAYGGPDPDGFMTAGEVVALLRPLRRVVRGAGAASTPPSSASPPDGDGFVVDTDDGEFRSCNVVDRHRLVRPAGDPGDVRGTSRRASTRWSPSNYRNPDDLPTGGVLVVGASATGVQLAEELHASGRPVTLAVGRHSRMPRTYRGMDAFWWLDLIGALDKTIDDVDDRRRGPHRAIPAARRPHRTAAPSTFGTCRRWACASSAG